MINPKILEAGWGPEYGAGKILEELSNGHPRIAACYYNDILRMSRGELLPAAAAESKRLRSMHVGRAAAALVKLKELLTPEQWKVLTK